MEEQSQAKPQSPSRKLGSAKSGRSAAVSEAGDQLLDVGQCKEHQRPFEAFCETCKVLVCPSCIMFGKIHKQHPVSELQDALKQLRSDLYSQLEKGRLKVDYTESVLLDIRQAILTCDQMKNKLVNRVNDSFSKLIKAIKNRKAELLGEIDNYFEAERVKIMAHEEDWKEKQKLSQDLLRLNNSTATDSELLQSGKYVYESIARLNEPIKFQEMKLINSLDDSLRLAASAVKYVEEAPKEEEEKKNAEEDDDESRPRDIDINLHELVNMLNSYMQISEFKSLQYKA